MTDQATHFPRLNRHAVKKHVQQFNLKAGLIISLVFPAIFTFAQPDNTFTTVVLRFFNYFLFIGSTWILNHALIRFSFDGRKATRSEKLSRYLLIALTSVLSLVIYLLLAVVFRQEIATLASLFSNGFSAKAWFFLALRIILFNAGIILTKYLFDSSAEQRRILLENELLRRAHLDARHESLRQQVDPHFLYNSLNTLQSLVKQHSDQSLAFISELAAVYRYMLVRRDRRCVTVGEELDFLTSYLYLLKIRFGESFQLRVDVCAAHHATLIPPHTLQLLAENAVKHNKFNLRQPLCIEIFTSNDMLVVCNNLWLKTRVRDESSGIGLNNIIDRYALLFSRQIDIRQTDRIFEVSLPLIHADEYTDH